MLGRLVVGIIKGLVVGGLVGFGLAKLGFVAPGAVIAYLAAAVTGVLIGLVAGKPIWAKDAKIEAGMKAFVGALLGVGLMFVARRWLLVPVPFSLGPLSAPDPSLHAQFGTIGGLSVTSLAAVAAVLGGFYEADNTPTPEEKTPAPRAKAAAGNKRIAAADLGDDEADELELENEKRRSKK